MFKEIKSYKKGVTKESVTIYNFDNSSDIINFIKNTKINDAFHRREETIGIESDNRTIYYFNESKTNSLEEAFQMLQNGWDYMSEKLFAEFKKEMARESYTGIKNVYSTVGYQACVPRYLQGIPTNMIQQRRVVKKDKVIVINKSISYWGNVSSDDIIKESVKVMKVIAGLESKGHRVELNIVDGSYSAYTNVKVAVKLCIKKSGERMNIKKITFPLVHPSMLRRISFAITERMEETSEAGFTEAYGRPLELENVFKGEYYFPAIIEEEEIIDMEKYRVV